LTTTSTDANDTSGATVPLETLTDEELAILAGEEGIVVSPFLASADPSERRVVLRTAYRGLLARGLVDPPTPEARAAAVEARAVDGDRATVELMVRQDVLSMVTLREAARLVVAAARTTVAGQDFWYAHVVDDVVLLEEVSADGLHRFALDRTAALPDLVEAAVVHPEAGDGEGEELAWQPANATDPTPPEPIVAGLGASLVRCDLVVRHVGDEHPPMLGLFSGPGGSWSMRSEHGSREPVVVRPVTADALRDEVRRLVTERLAQATVTVDGVPRGGQQS
jgi:hypothetical protein